MANAPSQDAPKDTSQITFLLSADLAMTLVFHAALLLKPAAPPALQISIWT